MLGVCKTCAAKDQTIALLADLVDWHRSQIGLTLQSAGDTIRPRTFQPERTDQRMWVDDDEEDVIAALESGALSTEAAEQALASIQAMNQSVHLVK